MESPIASEPPEFPSSGPPTGEAKRNNVRKTQPRKVHRRIENTIHTKILDVSETWPEIDPQSTKDTGKQPNRESSIFLKRTMPWQRIHKRYCILTTTLRRPPEEDYDSYTHHGKSLPQLPGHFQSREGSLSEHLPGSPEGTLKRMMTVKPII